MREKRKDAARPRPRMPRNADLGEGCRTVFLPTLDALALWWSEHRGTYPVMGYFCVDTDLLEEPLEDGNDECEWVVGPSVEAVVAKMLTHCGLSVQPVWSEGFYEGSEWFPGCWRLFDLEACPETEDAGWQLAFSDQGVSAAEAAATMLRQFGLDCANDILRVWVGDDVDRLIASEQATRADDCIDYYGYQNEERVLSGDQRVRPDEDMHHGVEIPPVKMYILVRDDVALGFAMVAVAHASLAGYLKFRDTPEVAEWLSGPFFKAVCTVNANEFDSAKAVPDHLVLTESALNDREVAIVLKPRREWPKMFRFLKLYREPPRIERSTSDN